MRKFHHRYPAEATRYVDELYGFLFVTPLWVASNLFYYFDMLIVDGLVNLAGWLPRGVGRSLRPSQSGQLHGYAVGMAGGIGFLILIVLVVTMLIFRGSRKLVYYEGLKT